MVGFQPQLVQIQILQNHIFFDFRVHLQPQENLISLCQAEPWNQIASTFERCWFKKVEDGTGLEDVNMDDVVNLIVKSIGGSQM